MDGRINRLSTAANITAYNAEVTRNYLDSAPHIKHASLRKLYTSLLNQVYNYAEKCSKAPRVLDLGAGEGSATLQFLRLGAYVTAVDTSKSQLDSLRKKVKSDRLELRCEDIWKTLENKGQQYDIVVANSFLHHIPDYLDMIRQAIDLLTPNGQFFSFQDPLRYDTVGKFTKIFSDIAYFSWRISKEDVWGGVKRHVRRRRGVYLSESVHDNTDYHIVRNGIDQDAIIDLLKNVDIDCRVVRYFSTQSLLFQKIGSAIGMKNTFGLIAQKSQRE
jgi:SAM-dependent methyltransferase